MSLIINQRVKEERKRQGYTQHFIARALDMQDSTYSQMERNGKISAEKLVEISKIFNTDIRYFLYGEERYIFEKKEEKNIYTTQEESIITILRNLNSNDQNDVIKYIENKYKAQKSR